MKSSTQKKEFKKMIQMGNSTIYRNIGLTVLALCLVALNAMAQPGFSQAFTSSTIGPGSTSTLTFTIDNTTGSVLTGMAFSSTLPVGVTVADAPAVFTSCTDGMASATAGGSTLTLSDGRLGDGSTCTVTVNVTSTVVATHTNASVMLTSSFMGGAPFSGTADLTVAADRPGFSKSFSPATIDLGETTTLTFTIDNTANSLINTTLNILDILPDGMVIASPSNITLTGCDAEVILGTSIPPTITAVSGTSLISVSTSQVNGVAAMGTCTVVIEVQANATGTLENVTSDLTHYNFSTFTTVVDGKASATLEVTRAPIHIIKSFTNDPAPSGGTVDLEFTIKNFDRDFDATAVTFTDDLDAALMGLAPAGALPTDPCGAGSMLSFAGGVLTLTGGTLASNGGECTFTVTCDIPAGTAPGIYTNVTNMVSGTVDGSPVTGNDASANLFVAPRPTISKTFLTDPATPGGTTVLEFTITNTSLTDDLTDISFTDEFDQIFQTASVVPVNGDCGAGSILTFTPLSNFPMSPTEPAKLTLSGGTIPMGGSCTFSITLDVPAGTPPGIYSNTTSEITGMVNGEALTGSPATDDVEILAAPDIIKSFASDQVAPGGQVDLTFTLNLDEFATSDATDIAFTDDLSAFLVGTTVATPNNLVTDCSGTVTAVAGSSTISLSGGTLTPGSSCTITVTVEAGASDGIFTNTTSNVTATVGGLSVTGNAASDDLVVSNFSFTKEFIGNPALPGETVALRFVFDNSNGVNDVNIALYQDNLETVLTGLVAVQPPTFDDCGITVSGTTSLSFSGIIAAGNVCSIEFDVLIPAGAASGTYTNATTNLFAIIDAVFINFPPATDQLVIDNDLLDISKTFTNDPVLAGGTVDLEFTITNLDPVRQIDNITFMDDLDATLPGLVTSVLPATPCGGASSLSGGSTLTLTGGSLVGGASCTFTVTLQLPATVAGNKFTNTTGEVSGDVMGATVVGGTATDELLVRTLRLSKSFDGPASANGSAMLTFTLENLDLVNAIQDIDFMDDLEAMLSGTTVSTPIMADISACGEDAKVEAKSTGMFAFENGDLEPGASCSFTIEILIPCDAPPGTHAYTNTTSEVLADGVQGEIPAPAATAFLTVTGATAATFTRPMDVTINCEEDTSPANTGDVTDEMHECCTGLDATFSDASTQTMDGSCTDYSYTITRTWSLVACNGLASPDQVQLITVVDNTIPEVTCPGSTTVECDADTAPSATGEATATDNCDASPVISSTDASTQTSDGSCTDFSYTITRTWKATDACGNESTTCDQVITVEDNTVPTVSCPAGLTVNCDDDTSPTGTGTATATDNCDASPVISSTDASTQTSDGSCTDFSYTITRTWKVTDACGNESTTCDQVITVVDNTVPTVNCPSPITIECDESAGPTNTGYATGMDNCDPDPILTFVDESDQTNTGDCTDQNYSIGRIWKATDACGNTSTTCTQTITVVDTNAPDITCPTDVTVECDASTAPASTGEATASDNCDTSPTISSSDVSTQTSNGSCTDHSYTITRTWVAEDNCGNSAPCDQVITVEDTTDPDITCPANITIECDESSDPADTGEATGTDNCDGSPAISSSDMSTQTSDGSCTDHSYTITRTWKAEDICGNMQTCDQIITVEDTTDPVASCPANVTVECDASTDPADTGEATGTDNCDGSPVITFADGSTQTDDGSCSDNSYTITRTWKATDDCGNMHTCDQIITVEDTTPPTVGCMDISVALTATGDLTITPSQVFDAATSSDNCSSTVTPISVSPNVFTCLEEGENTVTLTGEDACGNTNTCTAKVTVEEFITIISIDVTHETCTGAGNGTITISATAGGGQLGFSIDGGTNFQFTGLFEDLTPGIYNIVLKVFGIPAICEVTTTAEVLEATGVTPTWYKDLDDDGYTDYVTIVDCGQPAGYKLFADLEGSDTDCDDNDPLQKPGQEWYPDTDDDGYGEEPLVLVTQCERPTGHKTAAELTEIDTDCDDTDPDVNPGATEVCNGIDDNCDGNVDEGLSGETFTGNVTFATQADVDDWPACYSIIDGNVTVQGSGITDLSPLTNIVEVTGNLTIQFTGLTSMSGLDALAEVGGTVVIYFNSSLTSLSGLQTLGTVGASFIMYYNFALTDCCAIKDLVNGSGIAGSITIFFNATGCNSVADINNSCPNPVAAPGDEAFVNSGNCAGCGLPTESRVVEVYPNPVSSVLNILFSQAVGEGTVELKDIMGRQVAVYKITQSSKVHQFDMGGIIDGLYLLDIKIEGQQSVVKKIVVEQ